MKCYKVKEKKNRTRDPKSAATSNCILIVVMLTWLRGYFQITMKLFLKEKIVTILRTEVSRSSLLLLTNINCT